MTASPTNYRRFSTSAIVTSLTAFAYFSAVAGLLLESESNDAVTIAARAAASTVVGTLLAVRSQVERGTVIDAAREGLVLAVVVVMANGLFGSDILDRTFAIRSASIMLGLPLLAVLTHVLGQQRIGRYSD